MTNNTKVFTTEIPSLTQKHLDILREGSGLSIELIRERGYRTVLGAKQLADAGFAQSQQRPPGLLIPVHTVSGINKLFSYRPDFPRITRGKELKYELPRGTTARLDVPPRCLESIKDPSVTLWITEGQKKADALAMRMLSSLGRIDQHRLRTGKLNDDDWPRLTSAIALLNEAPLFIDDTPALSPTELRARARRLKREHGLSLIVIDYLQLMQGNAGKSSENRATEISEISRSLKALGKELEVPVIALSQLNRSLEQRPNKRPVMSDLRESGAIEQDADLIVFIYRDEVYNSDSPDKGKAEIIIGKQRNGPIGTVALTFQGKYTRFENFAPSYYDDQDNYPSYGEE